MNRRYFLVVLSALFALSSCARMDQREKRYDETQCPFCSVKPGVCIQCGGTLKCNICSGTGKVISKFTEDGKKITTSTAECSFCNGTGKCPKCNATGKCWACKGTGKVTDWDFYSQYKSQENKSQ